MTTQEIIESIDYCLECNNDSIPTTQEDLQTIKEALEKKIPKKAYKEKGRLQNNYFCSACRNYLGDERALLYAGLQPEYCQQCGQALDWSDI